MIIFQLWRKQFINHNHCLSQFSFGKEMDAQLRTDIQFDDMSDEDHPRGPTPLKSIQFGFDVGVCTGLHAFDWLGCCPQTDEFLVKRSHAEGLW